MPISCGNTCRRRNPARVGYARGDPGAAGVRAVGPAFASHWRGRGRPRGPSPRAIRRPVRPADQHGVDAQVLISTFGPQAVQPHALEEIRPRRLDIEPERAVRLSDQPLGLHLALRRSSAHQRAGPARQHRQVRTSLSSFCASAPENRNRRGGRRIVAFVAPCHSSASGLRVRHGVKTWRTTT